MIGVDPGFAHGGAALVHVAAQSTRSQIVEVGDLKTSTDQTIDARLDLFCDWLEEVVEWKHAGSRAEAIAFEDQAGAQIRQLKDPKRANAKILYVREVVGIVRAVARRHRMAVVRVDPKRAKIGVLGAGAGSADKKQIRQGILKLAGFDRFRWNEHKADAVAIAIAGARKLQHQRIGIKP